MFKKSEIIIVSSNGAEQSTKGLVAGSDLIVINDISALIEVGYEIRRTLPNGHDEVFDVIDPIYYEMGPDGPHYQVKVRKKGVMPHASGGNYYHASGPNARINVSSTDNSINTVGDKAVFGDLRTAVNNSDMPSEEKYSLLGKNKQTRSECWKQFIYASF